jgi:hypothetical protein
MLLPRFSLRLVLSAVTALCFFFLVLSAAYRGQSWAIAVSIAAGAAVLMLLIYAGLFLFAWLLAWVTGAGRSLQSWAVGKPALEVQSPFASDRLPPVLVSPPPDPED